MTPRKIVVHHADVIDGTNLQWGAIREYHINHNGWRDIGYHAGVELVDSRYETLIGRPWTMDGAHTVGQNNVALGICFVGDFDDAPVPSGQLVVGAKLIRTWMEMFGIPEEEVWPHRHFNATECPGDAFDMDALMDAVRRSEWQ